MNIEESLLVLGLNPDLYRLDDGSFDPRVVALLRQVFDIGSTKRATSSRQQHLAPRKLPLPPNKGRYKDEPAPPAVVLKASAEAFDLLTARMEIGRRELLPGDPPSKKMHCLVCHEDFFDQPASSQRPRPLRCPFCLVSHFEEVNK